jgi:large subunit ribosomal protein L19
LEVAPAAQKDNVGTMLRQPSLLAALRRCTISSRPPSSRCFSSSTDVVAEYQDAMTNFDIDEMAMMHHGKRPRFRNARKFKSPRKRASGLLDMLTREHVEKSKIGNPQVWKTEFRVGDAIEILHVDQGGIHSNQKDKMRGVVLGKVNRGLSTSIYIRDVVYGEPIDRKIHLHSPLLKTLTVLEENFVFKKRKKVKRAKLYYLRDRLPHFTKVTKW